MIVPDDTKEFDPWELSSGLLDDVDVVVKDAFFGYDSSYMDGQSLLMVWNLLVDDPDNPETEIFFSVGDKWETKDKGKTAQREDGKQAGFNQNSSYGSLIMAAAEVGAGDAIRQRGTPMEAGIWKGLGFHMERKEFEFKFADGTRKVNRLLPTKFLGEKGSGGNSKGEVAESTTDTSVAKPAASSSNGMSKATEVKLKNIAKKSEDFSAFIEAAYEIQEVAENSEVQTVVDDEDSFYTVHHG